MIETALVDERLWRVTVDVEGLTGETLVACETQEEAEAYARNVFLPDLRRNDWRFAHVRFPWEPEEVEADGDDTDQEV